MSSKKRKLLTRMALAVIVTVASGCAELGKRFNMPADEEVRLRAQAWADDVLAGDVESAWALTSPAYRQFSSAQRYKGEVAGTGRWTRAVVESVHCSEDACDVGLMVDYSIKRYNITNQRVLEQKWILVDGDWWLYVPVK
jgi:hypothetical protein